MSFTVEVEKEIAALVYGGESKAAVARKYSTSARTVGRICDRHPFDSIKAASKVTPVEVVDYEDDEVVAPLAQEKVPSKYKYFVIIDDRLFHITRVSIDGSEPPVSEIAPVGSNQYKEAYEAYLRGDDEAAFVAASIKRSIESVSFGNITVDPVSGTMKFRDSATEFVFGGSIVTRAVESIKNGNGVQNLLAFANRVVNNPSKRAVSELYDFLVASDIEITEDGMVRCYKKIRKNYTDVYSGNFDNSVGVTVEMPRFLVDDNSDVTCSQGLHVCSKAYLRHFGGERIVAVLVDPADFVSIPKDYYSIDGGEVKAKARVSKYVVVEELDPHTLKPISVEAEVA